MGIVQGDARVFIVLSGLAAIQLHVTVVCSRRVGCQVDA
jgi:hypothetical protein